MQWYYDTPSGRKGPVTIYQLKKIFLDGKITPETMLWKTGMPKPIPLMECADLFNIKESEETKISADDNLDYLDTPPEEPIEVVLILLAVFGMLCCAIAAFYYWPTHGSEAIAYLPSTIFLVSGIFGAVYLISILKILTYLRKIEKNTRGK